MEIQGYIVKMKKLNIKIGYLTERTKSLLRFLNKAYNKKGKEEMLETDNNGSLKQIEKINTTNIMKLEKNLNITLLSLCFKTCIIIKIDKLVNA